MGFYGILGLISLSYSTAFLYGIFVLKEVPPLDSKSPPAKCDPKRSFLKDFFDTQHIRDTFNLAFRSEKKNQRLKIILLMLIIIIVFGPQNGAVS